MLTGDILRFSARRDPNRTALIQGAARVSYGELWDDSLRTANAIGALGIGKGETVAVMSLNRPEYVAIHFGNAMSGAMLVNLMPAYAPEELVAILQQTRSRLIIVEAPYQEKIAEIADRLPDLKHVVVIGEPGQGGWLPFDRFVADQPATRPEIALNPDDTFSMTFTGGTTGLPKGAKVSHEARFVSAYTTAIEHEVREADTVGLLTPMYHAMGSCVWLPTVVLVGATIVMPARWDPDQMVEQTARHGINTVLMVPVQLRELLADAHFDAGALATLNNVACGGAITPVELVAEIAEKMPWARFTNHYGQSETGPVTLFKHNHPRDKAGTIGRPALGAEVELLDAGGAPVPVGEPGEIVVGGPFLMSGYYNNPEETELYFRGGDGRGWTGDLGCWDEDGFITLVGRSKDMIVSGGINIYPREIEIALEKHTSVAECTVFGVPDEKWGEALAALVVRRGARDLDEATLTAHCETQLAGFKRPKFIRFVNNIPKTPSGKVQKPKLRDAFLKELEKT
ncbi:MAG: class I adenylate-forming enzyme family protein [Alphaproteobacteria bacterium]